jgi:NAD/NADP transhydrogenase alpha subunit
MVGGFVVTDRMLEMFKPKKENPQGSAQENEIKKGGAK